MENATNDAITFSYNTSVMTELRLKCEENYSSIAILTSNKTAEADPPFDLIFNGFGLLFLSVVGATANILSVIVLSHPRLKSSLTTLLLGLTISDIIVIVTSFLIFSLPKLLSHSSTFSWYTAFGEPFLIPWLLPIALTAQMSSVYFTVVITLERYIAVCLPLHVRSICTRSSAKWTVTVVVLFSFLYNIPRWFEFNVEPSSVNCSTGEVTAYDYKPSDFRSEFFVTYYVNWAYLVFMYIIPFTVLLYFNAAIFKQTRMHRAIRNSMSPGMTTQQQHGGCGMTEDIQLACMLFGIVITFIACNMLVVVINVVENLGMIDQIGYLIPISNFLIVLACSTNFIFYCVFGREFRNRLRITLGLASSRKDSFTRSEIWTVKDDSPRNARQRSESLQIPSFAGSRPRSNSSSFPSFNNNDDTAKGMPARHSTTTVDTVIFQEV